MLGFKHIRTITVNSQISIRKGVNKNVNNHKHHCCVLHFISIQPQWEQVCCKNVSTPIRGGVYKSAVCRGGCLRFTSETGDGDRHSRVRARRRLPAIRILEECSDPTSAEGGSQSVLKVLQSLAGCAVYGMLDGLSSNVSSGHNTKMYTTALGPLLYAICNPHATYLQV